MRRALVPLGLLLLLAPATARAGAWTKGFGDFYAKIGHDWYGALRFVQTDGTEVDARYVGAQHSVYAEVGILPVHPLQLLVHVPVSMGSVSFADPRWLPDGRGTALTTRLGDLRLGLQGSVVPPAVREHFQLALAFDAKIPLYDNGDVGKDHGYWGRYFANPGDGNVDFTGMVRLGASIPGSPLWFEVGVGYRHRADLFVGFDPSYRYVDGIPVEVTLGANLGKVLVILDAGGVSNVARDDVTREWLALGLSALVPLPHGMGLQARVGGEPWARNASQGIAGSFGMYFTPPPEFERSGFRYRKR